MQTPESIMNQMAVKAAEKADIFDSNEGNMVEYKYMKETYKTFCDQEHQLSFMDKLLNKDEK